MLAMILRQHRRWLLALLVMSALSVVSLLMGRLPTGKSTEYAEYQAALFWTDPQLALIPILERLLIAFVLVTTSTVVFAVLIPSFLILIETLCTALVLKFVLVIGGVLEPGVRSSIEWIGLAVILIWYSAFYSGFMRSDGKGAKDVHWTLRFETKVPADLAFRRLVPAPETIDDLIMPRSRTFTSPQGSDVTFVVAMSARRGTFYLLEDIWMEIYEPHRHAVYRHAPSDQQAPYKFFHGGERRVTVEPTPKGSTVEVEVLFEKISRGGRLHAWLTQQPKDTTACWKARIEGRRDWSILGRTTLPPQHIAKTAKT